VLCTHVRSTCILRFSRSEFFRLSRCPSYTWAHIKYPSSLCVCMRVYKHTPTHHLNSHKNRKIYKTKSLSLPLPQHSLPRQQQALTHEQAGKKKPLPISSHTRMQVSKNTSDTHACDREIGQYNEQNALTRVHIYTHTRVYTHVYAYRYTDTFIHIHKYTLAHVHVYMHTHIHMHAYAHLYTN